MFGLRCFGQARFLNPIGIGEGFGGILRLSRINLVVAITQRHIDEFLLFGVPSHLGLKVRRAGDPVHLLDITVLKFHHIDVAPHDKRYFASIGLNREVGNTFIRSDVLLSQLLVILRHIEFELRCLASLHIIPVKLIKNLKNDNSAIARYGWIEDILFEMC